MNIPSIVWGGPTGIIIDQKGRLLFGTGGFLGKIDLTIANYSAGTVAVTSGITTIVGTGTTWTAGMVGKNIVIDNDPKLIFNVIGFTNATHINVDITPTKSVSGKSYYIQMGMDSTWKSFNETIITGDYNEDCLPMETYESDVYIGRKNVLACLHTNDDSFNSDTVPAFTLPTGFSIKFIKSGGLGILIGANFNNRGVLVLWDGISDRSVSPWIWLDEKVESSTYGNGGWIVVCSRSIISTTGYSYQKLWTSDNPKGAVFKTYPQGIILYNNKIIVANRIEETIISKIKCGYNIFDLENKKWCISVVGGKYFDNPSNENSLDIGAVFIDSNSNIYSSAMVNAMTQFVEIKTISSGKAAFITNPLGEGSSKKIAKAIRLVINPVKETRYSIASGNITVTAKIASVNRRIWRKVTTNANSANATTLKFDGTQAGWETPEIGDEVMVMGYSGNEGYLGTGASDNCGIIAHITAIATPDTSSEVWTLDTTLNSSPKSGTSVELSPFKKIGYVVLDSKNINEDIFFDIKNNIKARKFYLKLLIENAGTTPIEITDAQFIYDDLGYF
jgi:hypothetical protein